MLSRRAKKDEEIKLEEKPKKEVLKPKKQTPAEKLSFKEQRELTELPGIIEKLDAEQAKILAEMADPAFFQKTPKEISQTKSQLEAIAEELKKAYERWEYLEAR